MHSGGILRGEGAFEVYPVDGPGRVVVRAVGMRPVVGENEELTVGHVVAGVADAIPAASFYAIDEHELSRSLVTFTEMMPCGGVIANVGYVERGAEAVTFEHVGNHFGYDERALSAKSFFDTYHAGKYKRFGDILGDEWGNIVVKCVCLTFIL